MNTHKVVYVYPWNSPTAKKGSYFACHIDVRPDLPTVKEFPSFGDAKKWEKTANAQPVKDAHYLPE